MRAAVWVAAGFVLGALVSLLQDRAHGADGHAHCAACKARLERAPARVLTLVPGEAG